VSAHDLFDGGSVQVFSLNFRQGGGQPARVGVVHAITRKKCGLGFQMLSCIGDQDSRQPVAKPGFRYGLRVRFD